MGVRGYAPWNPKAEALHWVDCARKIGEEYRAEWPLTVRQIFYRLVAVYDYEKTEEAYTKLTQHLSRARRAGMIPWAMIRDGGQGKSLGAFWYDGAEDFVKSIKDAARNVTLNRQEGQEQVIELWCEAGGMVPILSSIARPYACRVNSGGGYDSVTAKHRLAERVRDRAQDGLKTLILHVGDFDGSGENMANVLREDTLHMAAVQVLRGVEAEEVELPADIELLEEDGDAYTYEATRWACEFFDVRRVALTGEQVVERNVITAPPKKSDSRTKEFIRSNREIVEALGTTEISAQLEALTPTELRELLSEQIEGAMDMEQYEAVREREREISRDVTERLKDVR